jgi:hypothetical protein
MPSKKIKTIEYGPVNSTYGYSNVRWVENASRGLRLVGFADKIVSLNHHGWYTYDDGPYEIYRGVVYQLPTQHGGSTAFVYGYADPNNDDCALLCFGDIEVSKEDAARSADRFAGIFAEHERDYHRASEAGRRYEWLAEQVKELRTEALTIGAEMRAARATKIAAPTICATLRGQIMALYKRIQKIRLERAELLDSFGNCPGFTE